MNKELINEAIEYVNTIDQFVLDKSPEIVQETINYAYMSSICSLLITLPIIIGYILICIYAFTREDGESFYPLLIAAIPICFFLFYPTICALDCILKISYSPRTYVIEKLKSL